MKGSKSKSQHIWNNEEKIYLSEITPGKHYCEILELMNEKFEYQFTITQIKCAINRYKLNTGFTGQFKKGNTPYNKGVKGLTRPNRTSFKNGNIPANHKPVGSERVDVDGYRLVKVGEPNKWKMKHRLIWEKENGEIPSDSVVIFCDGNKNNLDIDNLTLITKKQLLVLNKNRLIKEDGELTKVGINIANVLIKIGEIKNKNK